MARHRWQARRLVGLDGMRAFAVLAVFAYHLTSSLPGGWAGVDVFFVLSGYLITDLLIREYRRTSKVNLANFWGRRAVRLLPAMATALVIVLAVGWWRAGPGGIRNLWLGALTVLAYVGNVRAIEPASMPLLAHLWSLSLEEQFYLTWPLALWFALRRGVTLTRITKWLLVAIVLVIVNCGAQYLAGVSPLSLADLPDTHSAGLLMGCALALWLAEHQLSERQQRRVQVGAIALVIASPLFIVGAQFESATPFTWGYTAVSLATVVLLVERICCPTRLLNGIFEARAAVWLGQRSYEFYLLHYPVLVMLQRADLGTVARLVVGLPLTIVMSALIHELWQPVQRRLRLRLDARRNRPAAARQAIGVHRSVAVSASLVGIRHPAAVINLSESEDGRLPARDPRA